MFREDCPDNILSLNWILMCFEVIFGLRIDLAKSEITPFIKAVKNVELIRELE